MPSLAAHDSCTPDRPTPQLSRLQGPPWQQLTSRSSSVPQPEQHEVQEVEEVVGELAELGEQVGLGAHDRPRRHHEDRDLGGALGRGAFSLCLAWLRACAGQQAWCGSHAHLDLAVTEPGAFSSRSHLGVSFVRLLGLAVGEEAFCSCDTVGLVFELLYFNQTEKKKITRHLQDRRDQHPFAWPLPREPSGDAGGACRHCSHSTS